MTTPLQGSRAEADYTQSRRDLAATTWRRFTHIRTRKSALKAARDTWANITAKESHTGASDAAARAADVWHLLDTRHSRINL